LIGLIIFEVKVEVKVEVEVEVKVEETRLSKIDKTRFKRLRRKI